MAEIEEVVQHPEQTIVEDDLTVYQKIMYADNRPYLIRVFVNESKQPPVAVTAYKTSKIEKYRKL